MEYLNSWQGIKASITKWSRVWSLLPHSFNKMLNFGTRYMKLCINYDLLWEEAYNFIFQFKLLELLVDDINDVSIFVKFHQFPQSVSVETEQLQLVFFLSHFTIPLPFHSSFLLLLLLFKSFLPLVISFSKSTFGKTILGRV